MKEKDLQVLWTKYVKANWKTTAVFELKICKAKTFNFNKIERHQIQSLKDANHACITHKISDQSAGFKPFDEFTICNADAFLVLLFYKPRQKKEVILININTLLTLLSKGCKSITEAEARLNSEYIIIL